MAYGDWVNERAAELASLAGRRIVAWAGVEMAFRGGEDGVPAEFTNVSLPFLQLWGLAVTFDDHSATEVGTYQNNDIFGLWLRPYEPPTLGDDDGILRLRPQLPLPTGLVANVTVLLAGRHIGQVHLSIGEYTLALAAGETYEHHDGSVSVNPMDESVLAFTDLAAMNRVSWSVPWPTLKPFGSP
jgi:hypothetical protein